MNLPDGFTMLGLAGVIVELDPSDAARAIAIQAKSRKLDKDHLWVEPETMVRRQEQDENLKPVEWSLGLSWSLDLAEGQRNNICKNGKSPRASVWLNLGNTEGYFHIVRNIPFRKLVKSGNWQDMFCVKSATVPNQKEPQSARP